ncbi:hypothetical protein BH20ACI3_BH20ACI3_32400 [soil metagenome]
MTLTEVSSSMVMAVLFRRIMVWPLTFAKMGLESTKLKMSA